MDGFSAGARASPHHVLLVHAAAAVESIHGRHARVAAAAAHGHELSALLLALQLLNHVLQVARLPVVWRGWRRAGTR